MCTQLLSNARSERCTGSESRGRRQAGREEAGEQGGVLGRGDGARFRHVARGRPLGVPCPGSAVDAGLRPRWVPSHEQSRGPVAGAAPSPAEWRGAPWPCPRAGCAPCPRPPSAGSSHARRRPHAGRVAGGGSREAPASAAVGAGSVDCVGGCGRGRSGRDTRRPSRGRGQGRRPVATTWWPWGRPTEHGGPDRTRRASPWAPRGHTGQGTRNDMQVALPTVTRAPSGDPADGRREPQRAKHRGARARSGR